MTAEPDLLPCPFCGSENIDPKGWASTDSAGPACDDCGASAGGVSGTLQDNIARWNTRANVAHAVAAKDAEIEALEVQIAGLTAQVEHHTAYAITHRGVLRYCTSGMRDAYSDEKVRADAAEALAERLAEALRLFLQAGVGNSTDFYVQHNAILAARAALEQEATNG